MRLHIVRRLITVILSALLLSVAAPMTAQDAPASTPWPTVDNPAIRFDSDRAESLLGQPGVVQLIVNFTTLEQPDTLGYTTLVLRTVDTEVYQVVNSRIDNQPVPVTPITDLTGYTWLMPSAIGTHVLVADLRMLKPITPETIALVVPNADGSDAALAYLSEASVAQLAAAQQQVATPTPTLTTTPQLTGTLTVTLTTAATAAVLPAATATKPPPATLAPTITAAAATTATPALDVPLATPLPAATGGDNNDRLVPLLLGGLFLLAALAIGGLLLMRRRRRPVARAIPTAVPRPTTVPLPPVGAETMTGVLVPVYLELEGDAPQVFPVNETPFSIGRDPDNSLAIDETIPGWQTVSRQHALISRHDRGYVIEDLGSQNGVRVNGRLTPKNLLRNGWQVSVGGVTFRFVDETQTN